MEPRSHHHLSTAATSNASSSASSSSSSRRSICPNCSRPNPVCLCKFLPSQPIQTKTKIIILQHPHESHHKLSTTPILTKCLLNSTTIINRRLRPGLSDLLDQSPPAIYLFPSSPSSPSLSLSNLNSTISIPNSDTDSDLVLIVFDGTWKHAKEMVRSSEGFLSKFAVRVCFEVDEEVEGGSIYDSELILRKEPCGGCVSTMEAVARCLGVVEKSNGLEIERTLIRVLREMVRLQAQYLKKKPVKLRPKMLKKNRMEKKDEFE